jgi:hypothetical protein
MTALPGNEKREELVREYRIALGLWSETRALYPSDSAEVERATEHLAILEYQLARSNAPATDPLVPALESQA